MCAKTTHTANTFNFFIAKFILKHNARDQYFFLCVFAEGMDGPQSHLLLLCLRANTPPPWGVSTHFNGEKQCTTMQKQKSFSGIFTYSIITACLLPPFVLVVGFLAASRVALFLRVWPTRLGDRFRHAVGDTTISSFDSTILIDKF